MPEKERLKGLILKASIDDIEQIFIPRIVERQTTSERIGKKTIEQNHIGLNQKDAPFITSLYKQIKEGKYLTEKQINAARKVLSKYWKQYLEMGVIS